MKRPNSQLDYDNDCGNLFYLQDSIYRAAINFVSGLTSSSVYSVNMLIFFFFSIKDIFELN
jgi:hypothetical protein